MSEGAIDKSVVYCSIPVVMNPIYTVIMPALLGLSLTVGAFTLDSSDILASAKEAANSVSRHEIRNALELYYLDNGSYPMTSNEELVISELFEGGYIENKPTSIFTFDYEVLDSGEDYNLK